MAKLQDHRYLDAEDKFLEYSYQAVKGQFKSRDDFGTFYNKIDSDDKKNHFLKTASFYLFLVKNGDWSVDVPGSSTSIDYLSDTYKYVAIFSLIESISDNVYIDFYSYLIRRRSHVQFPIQYKAELEKYYRDYKKEFGSVQMSDSFFSSLSEKSKALLISSLEVKGTSPTITNLSKYLYNLRSKFVHEAQLVLNMSCRTTVSRYGKKLVICKLPIERLMMFFEEGLVTYFS